MGTSSPSELISLDMHCLEQVCCKWSTELALSPISCWKGGHLCVCWGLSGVSHQPYSLLHGELGRRKEREETLGEELVMPGSVVVLS